MIFTLPFNDKICLHMSYQFILM